MFMYVTSRQRLFAIIVLKEETGIYRKEVMKEWGGTLGKGRRRGSMDPKKKICILCGKFECPQAST